MFGWKRKCNDLIAENKALLDENKTLSKRLEETKKSYANKCRELDEHFEHIKRLDSTLNFKIKEIVELGNEIKKLKKKIKEQYGAKGGLTKENNRLITKNTELRLRNDQLGQENKELHDLNEKLLSKRYKVIKLKGTNATKEDIQTLGIKRGVSNSKVKKELKKKNESEEK